MTTYRSDRWEVVVEPSIFRQQDTFTLGRYRWKCLAWLAAWVHVTNNPHALAVVKRRAVETPTK